MSMTMNDLTVALVMVLVGWLFLSAAYHALTHPQRKREALRLAQARRRVAQFERYCRLLRGEG